nr:GatB/YqeY domain-containing protein [Pseudomonas sp.]
MSDSTLKIRLSDEMKNAMRAKDAPRLGTLRLVLAAIKQKEVDERRELSDADIVAILEKQVKQRRESIVAYEQAGRTETADQEKAEIVVLQEFLPQGADPAEVQAIVDEAVATVAAQGVSGPPAMGKAMAIIKPRLAGRADMSEVSKLLSARLKGA